MEVETITNIYNDDGKLIDTKTTTREYPDDRLLSLMQAAKLMGLSRQTLWLYCQKGTIDYKFLDGHYYIKESDAVNFKRPIRGARTQAA